MTLWVQVNRLFPATPRAHGDLWALTRHFWSATEWLAREALASGCRSKVKLQRSHYRDLRDRFALPSAHAVKAIAMAIEALRHCPPGRNVRFPFDAAMPLDARSARILHGGRIRLRGLVDWFVVPYVTAGYVPGGFARLRGYSWVGGEGAWWWLQEVDLPEEAGQSVPLFHDTGALPPQLAPCRR